jgi:hypothetical protein
MKKPKKRKMTNKIRSNSIKSKVKKKTQTSSIDNYPSWVFEEKKYYFSIKFYRSFPCFRPFGRINCPKNKLPMPRDLWYRIVYSQVLEQQLGRSLTIEKNILLI